MPGGTVRTRKLALHCPVCNSPDVFYTCTPNCCFNHVCAQCGTTFEPMTQRTGKRLSGVLPPDPPPDATDPTAECANCDSVEVSLTEDGAAVCVQCGAVLTIELTEVTPADGS